MLWFNKLRDAWFEIGESDREFSIGQANVGMALLTMFFTGLAIIILDVCGCSLNWWYMLWFTIGFGEILYISEKNKPKKKNSHFWGKFWFTAGRKFMNLLEAYATAIGLRFVFPIFYYAYKFITNMPDFDWVRFWAVYGPVIKGIGISILIVVGVFLYIWLNSLKFKNGGKK